MDIDYVTETQGNKIIDLLTKILKELEELRGIAYMQQEANKKLHRIEVALDKRT